MVTKIGSLADKSLTPIAVLIEELKSDEIKRRVNSVKNLSTIAVAMGLDKTKSELIPFLSGS